MPDFTDNQNELPTPPSGSWWEITGEPKGPWVWSSESVCTHDEFGRVISVEYVAVASAPGATAIWRH